MYPIWELKPYGGELRPEISDRFHAMHTVFEDHHKLHELLPLSAHYPLRAYVVSDASATKGGDLPPPSSPLPVLRKPPHRKRCVIQ